MAPLLLRTAARTAFARSTALNRQLPALAILVPRRGVSGQPSTSSSNQGNYPPPGFNAEQAKKPLDNDSNTQSQPKSDNSKSASSDLPNIDIPSHKPTEHPPTNAAEQHALNELAAAKSAEDKAEEKKLAKKKDEEKKLTLRQKIMKEVHHYWDGTKLLGTEVKISTKLALKMAAGYELTRREHRQVHNPLDHTIADSTC